MDFGVGSQASRSGEGHRSTSIPGTGYSATPSVLPPTRSTYPTSPGHTCPRTTPTTSRSRRRAARALRPTVTSSTHGNSNSMFPSRAAPPANGAQHILPAGGVARPTARTGPGQASIRASVQLTASSSRDGRSDRQAPRPDLYYQDKHDRARQTLHGIDEQVRKPETPRLAGLYPVAINVPAQGRHLGAAAEAAPTESMAMAVWLDRPVHRGRDPPLTQAA